MFRFIRRATNESGFTLIEGLVSILLMSITVIGIYNIVIVSHEFVIDARRVTQATNFARKKLEKIMDTDFMDIPSVYPDSINYAVSTASTPEEPFEYDPDGDYLEGLPNAMWRVEYYPSPLSGVPSDPLTIKLIVSWQEIDSGNRERSVYLSTRTTAGKM